MSVLKVILFFYFFTSFSTLSLDLVEPDIQCTVIKVVKSRASIGFNEFPKKFDTINNSGLLSKLTIRGVPFTKASPVSTSKTLNSESILIKIKDSSLVLELKGLPMSRQGLLKVNGVKVAQVTCH